MLRKWWMAPAAAGFIGLGLSCFAFWIAERADSRRVQGVLELRSEWRTRDLQAKIQMAGNAVEHLAIALAANPSIDREQFDHLARRARRGLVHVNSLQWAPRVPREEVSEFEQFARSLGMGDYRLFDVTPDFQRTELAEREEYFPVLFEARFHGKKHVAGLALGRYDGRRIPMTKAKEEGRPVATLPVRPIGPPTADLVYLLFWPVYGGIEVPATVEERRAKFLGYSLGNYNLTALLAASIRDTPEIVATIRFSISSSHQVRSADQAAVIYSSSDGSIRSAVEATEPVGNGALRIARHFEVFDQHWDLIFDYSPAAVAAFRSQGAWGWLFAGLFLTASLVLYLLRERERSAAIKAQVVERTAELERTSAQLQQAQKMEAIGTLTGGMAHDFNNLLSVIIGNLDLLEERLKGDPKAQALAEAALQAGVRGAELTRQLLAFARRQPLEPQLININELVSGMTRLLERILEEHIEVTLVTAPDLWPVMVDPAQLSSAIANLATNARDAMPTGGRLTIETKNTHLDAHYAELNPDVVPGDYVLLEVSDTGMGMTPETLAQAFEPFFTTKEVGQGSGLGLSMVFGFVKQSQGHIKIYSEAGEGTTVRLYLRRSERGKSAPATADALVHPRRGDEAILVVEDNPDVRSAVTSQLADLGYSVIGAESPRAALALLKDRAIAVDLLFTDIVMPGSMNGHDLARAALAERPGLRVLYTSGYSGSSLRGHDRLKEGEHFLSKPYRKQELARKLREILDR